MKEYRWSKIWSGQGHYPLYKNLENAIKQAYTEANKGGDPILVQQWKPKSDIIYIVRPRKMLAYSKKTIVSIYKDEGYDVKYINKKNYKFKEV